MAVTTARRPRSRLFGKMADAGDGTMAASLEAFRRYEVSINRYRCSHSRRRRSIPAASPTRSGDLMYNENPEQMTLILTGKPSAHTFEEWTAIAIGVLERFSGLLGDAPRRTYLSITDSGRQKKYRSLKSLGERLNDMYGRAPGCYQWNVSVLRTGDRGRFSVGTAYGESLSVKRQLPDSPRSTLVLVLALPDMDEAIRVATGLFTELPPRWGATTGSMSGWFQGIRRGFHRDAGMVSEMSDGIIVDDLALSKLGGLPALVPFCVDTTSYTFDGETLTTLVSTGESTDPLLMIS